MTAWPRGAGLATGLAQYAGAGQPRAHRTLPSAARAGKNRPDRRLAADEYCLQQAAGLELTTTEANLAKVTIKTTRFRSWLWRWNLPAIMA